MNDDIESPVISWVSMFASLFPPSSKVPTMAQFCDLYEKAKLTARVVSHNAKAVNRNIIGTIPAGQIKRGWVQRAAKDQRSWAKPKGWKV